MKAHVQKVAHSRESSWVYRVKADPRFSRGWHYHPEYELTYIHASQGQRIVGDRIENYRSGDLVLLGPNLPHTWRSEDHTQQDRSRRALHRAIVIQFSESFLGDRFLQLPEMAEVEGVLSRSARGLHIGGTTRDEVVRYMTTMAKLNRFDRLLKLLRLLQVLACGGKDVKVICRTPTVVLPNQTRQRRIDRVVQFLHARCTSPLTQSEVASSAGISPAGFSRFFKKATGMRFVDYLAELRISHACGLLIDTEFSILDISTRSGFNNLSNFNRRFMRSKKMTPRQYRSRHAQLVG